jgi:hypothetical protein
MDRAMKIEDVAKEIVLASGGDSSRIPEAEQLIRRVVLDEREQCCSLVYGMCGSDNVAERTVRAIRGRSLS